MFPIISYMIMKAVMIIRCGSRIRCPDMSSQSQPLETLEALLSQACQIADALGLDLAAIRIEEALMVARDPHGSNPLWQDSWGTMSVLN